MRFPVYVVASTAMAMAVAAAAYAENRSFYTACVYISRSSGAMMVVMNLGLLFTLCLGKLLQKTFFGSLRTVEVEHLYERSWFAVTETCLAMTIFRDEFDTRFVAIFTLLLFLKIFHWLAQDRVDYMEQGPMLPRLFHVRMVALLNLLGFIDALLIAYAVSVSIKKGPSMMIMFGFEYTILFATVVATAVKYLLHIVDMRTDEPWEEKSMYVFYLELASDFVKLITYMVFFSLILMFYGLPLHIVRDVYLTLRSFMNKCRDLVRYRRATRNMNERYPDATEEELTRMTDRTCIICREEMRRATAPTAANLPAADGGAAPAVARPVRPARVRPTGETPKKLPCGHIFHFHCLRSWLERQQSCPTCRRPVLQEEIQAATTPNRAVGGAQAGQRGNNPLAGQRQIPLRPEHLAPPPAGMPAGFPGVLGGAPALAPGYHPSVQIPTRQPQQQHEGQEGGSSSEAASSSTSAASAADGTALGTNGSGDGAASSPVRPLGSRPAAGATQPGTPAYPPPYNPHLIPLFPLPMAGGVTMVFQRHRDAHPPTGGQTRTAPSQSSTTPLGTGGLMSSIGSRLPPEIQLTEDQIHVLGERTRESLVERLRMLETIDSHIWNTMTTIVRTLSAMETGDAEVQESVASGTAEPGAAT